MKEYLGYGMGYEGKPGIDRMVNILLLLFGFSNLKPRKDSQVYVNDSQREGTGRNKNLRRPYWNRIIKDKCEQIYFARAVLFATRQGGVVLTGHEAWSEVLKHCTSWSWSFCVSVSLYICRSLCLSLSPSSPTDFHYSTSVSIVGMLKTTTSQRHASVMSVCPRDVKSHGRHKV